MRFKGVIKSWNDERGFGFIQPVRDGDEIFVHIKAFSRRMGRPQVSQRVTFEVEFGPQGKRARNVEIWSARPGAMEAARDSRAPRGTASLITIPLFLVVYFVASLLWDPPLWFGLVYLIASPVTFLAYANDKSCAKRGAWRTSENALHTLSLAGGWPGALLAQQLLRHKSAKAEFRLVFWGTVALNVAAFIILCSQMGRLLWAQ
jgi:uncharacterized membrane protein YsdA (DUF1294 family)/cold shock CspA family protein